jgi:hypothetical protein
MVTTAYPLFLIGDPTGEAPLEVCSGPDASGLCPACAEGERVPCAGRDLSLLTTDPATHWSMSVSAAEDECPVRIMCAGGG